MRTRILAIVFVLITSLCLLVSADALVPGSQIQSKDKGNANPRDEVLDEHSSKQVVEKWMLAPLSILSQNSSGKAESNQIFVTEPDFNEMEDMVTAGGTGEKNILMVHNLPQFVKRPKNPKETEKFSREVQFYSSIPPEIRSLFPLLTWYDPITYAYSLELIFAYSVGDLLWSGKKVNARDAITYWMQAFNAFMGIRERYKESVPDGFGTSNWSKSIREIMEQLETNHANRFSSIVSSHRINIDGNEYVNIPQALSYIQELISIDKTGLLSPPYLTLIHGDLHLQNILATTPLRLIDPGGISQPTIRMTGSKIDNLDEILRSFRRGDDPLKELVKLVHSYEIMHWHKGVVGIKEIGSEDSNIGGGNYKALIDESLKDYSRSFAGLLPEIDAMVSSSNSWLVDFFGENWRIRFWYLYASSTIAGTASFADKYNSASDFRPQTRCLMGMIYLNRFAAMYIRELQKRSIRIPSEVIESFSGIVPFSNEGSLSPEIITFQYLEMNHLETQKSVQEMTVLSSV